MSQPRRNHRKRGPEPLMAKRDHYLRLMSQGMNNSAACREVGVNRKTGNRWRYGRTGSLHLTTAVAVTTTHAGRE